MQMGYPNDMIKKFDIASAFIHGKGVRWCPDCGVELVLSPKDPWINGVLCPHCKRMFSWQQWAHFREKWRWVEDNTSLVSFHGDEADVEVPHHCTRVCSYAFSNSSAITVRVPESVTVIEPFAFSNNDHLKKVELPAGLQRIEEGTFLGCDKLSQVYIPGTVKYIGMNAFSGCTSLKKVSIPESVLLIDEGAFAGSGLNEIVLSGTKVVAENAFSACNNLWSAVLRATQIGSRAFADCMNLREVKLIEGIMTIGEQAFFNCTSLEHLHVPASVYGFGNQAFAKVPRLSACIPKQLEEHIRQYRTYSPTYGAERCYLFENTAKLHFYEGGEKDDGKDV